MQASIFANLYEYVRANRHLLRYNYDPEGLPQLRIKLLDGRVIESISGPEVRVSALPHSCTHLHSHSHMHLHSHSHMHLHSHSCTHLHSHSRT